MSNYFENWCCLILFAKGTSQMEKENIENLFSENACEIIKSGLCTVHLYCNNADFALDHNTNQNLEEFVVQGKDFGEQVATAFHIAFESGFRKVIFMTDSCPDLNIDHIKEAFNCLKMIEFCIGPSGDGGIYLMGMNYLEPRIFENKDWHSSSVCKAIIRDIGNCKKALYKLPVLSSLEEGINMSVSV